MYGALVAQHTCAQDEKTMSVYTFHKDGEMFGSCLHDDTCTCKFTLTTLTLRAFKSVDFNKIFSKDQKPISTLSMSSRQ